MADHVSSSGLGVGDQVPTFSLPSSNGKTTGEKISLNQFKGQKLVLFFYPKDNTPGCTMESQQFSALAAQFRKLNTKVIGVSRDSLKSHEKFIGQFDLKMDLLSDSEEELCRLFNVIKEKNMYGKKVMGIERSTFVIDEKQKLVAEFRKVKADGHAAQVLEFVKSL